MFMIMVYYDIGYGDRSMDVFCNKPILLSSVGYNDHDILDDNVMYCGFYIRNSYIVLLEKVG